MTHWLTICRSEKVWLTDLRTTSNQEMLAHLKRHQGRTSCVIDTCCFLSGAKDAQWWMYVPHPTSLTPHVITQGSFSTPSPSTLLFGTPDFLIVWNHEENSQTKSYHLPSKSKMYQYFEYFDLLHPCLAGMAQTTWNSLSDLLVNCARPYL